MIDDESRIRESMLRYHDRMNNEDQKDRECD